MSDEENSYNRTMNLLKENFKNIDPEGLDNPGFSDNEKSGYKKNLDDCKKDHENPLEAKFVKSEKGIVEKLEPKLIIPAVPYYKLFRFATKGDIFLVFLGITFASVASLGLPYGMIMYGEFTTLLVDREVRTGESTATNILKNFGGGQVLVNATFEENFEAILKDSRAFGIGAFVGAFVQLIFAALSIDILNRTAQKQITRIRKVLLESVLRQDMTWYDLNTSENFAVKLTDDLDKMKEGISEKLAIFIYLLMSFVISVVFSFFYGWKLTLVILSCAPFIILSTAITAKVQSSLTEKELKSYSRAGAVAEEVLGNIRTVVGFNGEEKELDRYKDRLQSAEINGKKKGIYAGIGGGLMWFIIYCCYALAFWYGISLILDDRDKDDKDYTPAVLIIVLFGVLAGAQNLGLTSPHLEAFSSAKGSAVSIFNIIDRIPEIDSLGTKGKKPRKMTGTIKFSNVSFRYPARKDVKVLNGLTLEIEAGKTVALVGSSGCGKSTCIQLIQKFYNPLSGNVSVDGINVNDWNTQHLRKFIGVVSQEPVLFATTIRENIRYGNPDASNDEIEKAARIANCHNFIMKLSEGYETSIGERGAQLSGGQKQRIAIARAIVKNPKILLLDEATSALDPTSEKRVQDALDAASRGRTTVTVTHRLSTITNADKIVYINRGRVEEQGSHQELMEKKGFYFELVHTNNEHLTKSQESSTLHPNRSLRKSSRRKSLRSETSSLSDIDSDYSDSESDDDENIEKKEKHEKISTLGIIKMNSKEWPYISIGTLASCLVGASFPAFAVLFGEMYGILSLEDKAEVQRHANFYSILFLGLGVITGVSTFIQTYMFNSAGVRLTSRLRSMVFNSMMNQEMSWYDSPKNAVGALCARLAGDCAAVQGASGSRIGSIVQAGSVIIIGIGISFYYNWKMTLVASVSIPLVLISIVAEARLCEKSNIKEKMAIENASRIAIEAISNIRTVASLGQESHVLKRYVEEIDRIDGYCKKKLRYRGIVFGLGQTVPLMGYAMSLWYGGTLFARGEMPYQNVIKVGEALIFGSWMLGQALAYAPNVSAAIISASRIMNLLKRKPTIADPPNIMHPSSDVKGEINFRSVNFCYPSRKDILVLKDFNLEIEAGKTIALVGASGSGKSTCLQFLLRYYDPIDGQVEVDRVSTIDYSLSRLRSKFGVVGQEPVLFDRTIAENIAYGDNQRIIPMSEVIEAAKQANIHDFIIKLPNGYDQSLGAKGTQLSGGQKQRIAIARALIRKPEILLLDEATSALDTQSERIVQNALDEAKTGRTCIIIAHRLSTIQNADQICVFENGSVVEKGSHEELMKLGKKYAKLYRMQQIK